MTKEEAKEKLVLLINEIAGCKANELVARWCCQCSSQTELRMDLPALLDELVAEKRIQEVTYVLKTMDYREKSFYLPLCESINVK